MTPLKPKLLPLAVVGGLLALGLFLFVPALSRVRNSTFTQVGSTIGTTASMAPEAAGRIYREGRPRLGREVPTDDTAKPDGDGLPAALPASGAKPKATSPAPALPGMQSAGGRGGIGGGGIGGGIGGGAGGIGGGIGGGGGGIGGSPSGGRAGFFGDAGGKPSDAAPVDREALKALQEQEKKARGLPAGPAPGEFDRLQQEQYRHYADNGFKAVAQEPLSTFSADVNTAGYSNVRRYLANNTLPPAGAVRPAELLNFFPYSYPQPATGEPVAFALAAMPCPWQPQHQLVRVGLKAKQIDPAHAPPRNLVFLIDTSGSMRSPTRLPLVQKSLGMLIDQLTERDTVTVVTYAGSAGLQLPPTNGTQKGRIRAVVDSLSAEGSTNGAGGIALAYEQARLSFIEGGCNRVILCTDGDFNVGVTAEGDLVRTIEKERAGNVFLTILGYGMGNLKDATLEILARHGNGHYAYIDSEAEARKVFVEQGGALTAVAKDVKLQVEFNPALVSAYRLIGYENRKLQNEDFKNDAVDAGDMGSGHTVTALYEVVPAGLPLPTPGVDPLKYKHEPSATQAARSGEWLTAKMRYKHPESAKSLEVSAALSGETAARPADGDFRFAAAVAEFALLLRDNKDKGGASYDRVLAGAGGSIGADEFGHRGQFVELVRQARRLSGQQREEAVR